MSCTEVFLPAMKPNANSQRETTGARSVPIGQVARGQKSHEQNHGMFWRCDFPPSRERSKFSSSLVQKIRREIVVVCYPSTLGFRHVVPPSCAQNVPLLTDFARLFFSQPLEHTERYEVFPPPPLTAVPLPRPPNANMSG